MKEYMTDERGQVGIGTLIVFIALVLVAAIAAGVLINTAGLLQSQAESTGDESTSQVSNGLEVVSASHPTNADGDSLSGNPEVTVQLSPGSDPVDLEQLRIELSGDTGTSTLSFSGSNVYTLPDAPSDNVLQDSQDFATIELDDLSMSAGNEVQIKITTSDSSQTTELLVAPNPVDGEGNVRL